MNWNDASKTLPNTDRKVLCLTITKYGVLNHVLGYYDYVRWVCGANRNVIAWMELPDAPEWAFRLAHPERT